jgi:dTDP-4-dehydrorhamnose reductase
MVALTDVDKCEIRRDEAFKTNVAAAENLADYARKRPAAYVVHISTDMVYDGPGPHTESPVCPMNVYALTKYAGELAYRGINGCILRTNFFGKSRCLGRRSFSDWILEMGLSGKDASLFTDVLFSPLKMETIAQLLCVIFEKKVVGTFNLASNCGMSKRDFAHHLLAQFSVTHHGFKDALSTEHQFTAPRPRDMRMTPFRLEQVIGITMPTLLDEIRSMTR